MSQGRSPWQDGRRAWARLHRWYQENSAAVYGHPDDGDKALDAVADVGLVRRLLDQVELATVRTARRHGKSWAEIATRLGVTRQSAWERWRELDEPAANAPGETSSRREPVRATSEEAGQQEARARRRQPTVRVPDVVRMQWDAAREVLHKAGLVGISPDPDGPPLAELGWPDGVVTDQSPESGAMVPRGSSVTLWIERGGGSGVREPRRPSPREGTGYAMRDEPSDEAIS